MIKDIVQIAIVFYFFVIIAFVNAEGFWNRLTFKLLPGLFAMFVAADLAVKYREVFQ